MNLNRDIVPIWWVWLHDLDIPWHQRNHFKVRLWSRNKSWKSWTKIPAFLIQFSQILLGKLFIDSDLISPWLSGLLSHGNLLNTWLSPVSTLSSQQTRHGHQRWYLIVTILWQSCYGSLESVTLLNTTLAPHDTMRDNRDTVMSCVTRHGDGWLNNMRCLFKILSASSPKSIGRDESWFHSFSVVICILDDPPL